MKLYDIPVLPKNFTLLLMGNGSPVDVPSHGAPLVRANVSSARKLLVCPDKSGHKALGPTSASLSHS